MPQMMPMWWVLIFSITLFSYYSMMSVMSEEVIFLGKPEKTTSTSLSSWLPKKK